jgi:hypothetical protein
MSGKQLRAGIGPGQRASRAAAVIVVAACLAPAILGAGAMGVSGALAVGVQAAVTGVPVAVVAPACADGNHSDCQP